MRITGKKKDRIAPEMFGLFFEDINFAADGGLYAEMIENRSFEAQEALGIPGKFYSVADPGYAWSSVGEGKAPRLQYVQGTPLSEANPTYLRLTTYAPNQGVCNKAYDGICAKKGMNYKLSFYARCIEGANTTALTWSSEDGVDVQFVKDGKDYGSCHIALKPAAQYGPYSDVKEENFHTGWEAAQKIIDTRKKLDLTKFAKESEWVRYEGVITATEDIRNAEFRLLLDQPGVVEFDLISLIPEDAVCGIFRKDLFDALVAMHPGFIRFPGGCIVEGISLANRYNWKNTVGPLKDRKIIPNLWAFSDDRELTELDSQRPDAHYGQSYGIGFYEYFLLCELLGAKPLPVVGVGVACQFRCDEMIDITDPELQKYVQDTLDLIEFANGATTTKWGALRASMGHPDPFGLDLLAVGNEQWDTTRVDLFPRLNLFEKAIHEKYPEIRLCGTAGPGLDLPMAETAWNTYREKQKTNPNYCYAVDEHYYVSPQWMFERLNLYDDYPREVGVFAGEYAAHPANRGNNMEGALTEAAFLTGLEKNAGVVKLASYAPLFNRIGHSQWKPDMIWFDDKEVFLTPNYYVQKLYANFVGDYTMDMEGQEKELRKDQIYVSVVKKGDKTILKAVNCSDKEYVLPLTDASGAPISVNASVSTLVGTAEEPENLPQPSEITEKEIAIEGSVSLAPQSFAVICW